MQSQSEVSALRNQAPVVRKWHSPQIFELKTSVTRTGISGASSDTTNSETATIS